MSTCVDVESQPIAVTLTAGETFRVGVELTDANGQPVDITGWTWDVDLVDAGMTAVHDITVTVVDGPGGALELSIPDDITLSLAPADYTWPVWATDTASDTRKLFTGLLRIKGAGA